MGACPYFLRLPFNPHHLKLAPNATFAKYECIKTDLNFAFFISEYHPLVTIQAVMHEITADPAVFSNCTLG